MVGSFMNTEKYKNENFLLLVSGSVPYWEPFISGRVQRLQCNMIQIGDPREMPVYDSLVFEGISFFVFKEIVFLLFPCLVWAFCYTVKPLSWSMFIVRSILVAEN